MLALKKFYDIQLDCDQLLSSGTSQSVIDNILFTEIARTFGLNYWLRNELGGTSDEQEQ